MNPPSAEDEDQDGRSRPDDPPKPLAEAETLDWKAAEAAMSPVVGGRKPRGATSPSSAPAVDLDGFIRLLGEIGVMEGSAVRSFLERIPEPERPRSAGSLARELVRQGRLTDYQAGALLQGKTRGLLIASYRIIDKLGSGGMGIVFKAEHLVMKRVVALKLLPPSYTRDASNIVRFQREAEAAARLSHPNVVAALDAGEFKGLHYFVMEFVEGRDLHRVVKEEGPFPVDRAVACIAQAARGLQAAHAQGILHRDIKPSNLLLAADGTVKVLDLGLARLDPMAGADGGEALTRQGDVMGTVEYMSPEQSFDTSSLDGRSDIYSLGCTLFFLVAGRAPFPASRSALACALAHREQPIPSLRTDAPDFSPKLDAVVRRMMAKTPADRYPTMDALIDDLERFAAGRESSPVRRIGRRARLVLASTALLLIVAGVSIGFARGRRVPSTPTSPRSIAPAVVATSKAVPTPEVVAPERREPPAEPTTVAPVGSDSVPAPVAPVRINPRGPIELVRRFSLPHAQMVEAVAVSRDGKLVLGACVDQTVRVWDVASGSEVHGFRHEGPAYAVALATDGKRVLSASGDRTARVWDLESGRELVRFRGHSQSVFCVSVGPDGTQALSGGKDHTARLWDTSSGNETRRLDHAAPVVAASFLPDGRSALTASGMALTLWDLATGTASAVLEGSAEVLCLSVSSDGTRALSGDDDGSVSHWDLDRKVLIRRIEQPGRWVRCVGFANADRQALAGTQGGKLAVCDLDAGQAAFLAAGDAGHLGLAILPDGRHVATADMDGSVRLWKLSD